MIEALVSQGNISEVLVFCFDQCPTSDSCHNGNQSHVPSIREAVENKAAFHSKV